MTETSVRDHSRPLFHWYVDSAWGKELALALYTRPCRYGRCTFCSLPDMAAGGESVVAKDIERQVDYVLSCYSADQLEQLAKVSIYTASSTLDQECLPSRSLMYLALKICDLPHLKVVSLETRAEYVEDWELRFLRHIFPDHVEIEVGVGYETHDPILRNEVLGKGLTQEELLTLLQHLSANRMRLKAYLMLKPHYSLSEAEGITEAIAGVDELARLGEEHGVPVSIHLNPTYIAKGCQLTDDLVAHGYEPPELTSVIEVVGVADRRGIPIHVGLDDEGMAIEGGTFESHGLDRDRAVSALQAYNRHQDFEKLVRESGYTSRDTP